MSFVTKTVAGVPLNLTVGSNNTLVWAYHTSSYQKLYHNGRGHLNIVLNRGAAATPVSSGERVIGVSMKFFVAMTCVAATFLGMMM